MGVKTRPFILQLVSQICCDTSRTLHAQRRCTSITPATFLALDGDKQHRGLANALEGAILLADVTKRDKSCSKHVTLHNLCENHCKKQKRLLLETIVAAEAAATTTTTTTTTTNSNQVFVARYVTLGNFSCNLS